MTKVTPNDWDWDKHPAGIVALIVEEENLARRDRKRKKMALWTPQHKRLTPSEQINRAVNKWLGVDVQPGPTPDCLIPYTGMNSVEVSKGKYYVVLRNEGREIIATYLIKRSGVSFTLRKTPVHGERIYLEPLI